jgi:hypothetical protein
MRLSLAPLLVLVALACSTTPVPEASGPIDWSAVGDQSVPQILTRDPDGDTRETKLWLVVVDGDGIVRTGNTRWFRNIERDPNVVLRIGGADHPLRAAPIHDEEVRTRVHAAFRQKYGWQDRVAGWFGRPDDANIFRLIPR